MCDRSGFGVVERSWALHEKDGRSVSFWYRCKSTKHCALAVLESMISSPGRDLTLNNEAARHQTTAVRSVVILCARGIAEKLEGRRKSYATMRGVPSEGAPSEELVYGRFLVYHGDLIPCASRSHVNSSLDRERGAVCPISSSGDVTGLERCPIANCRPSSG